jgi:hypothetical protein
MNFIKLTRLKDGLYGFILTDTTGASIEFLSRDGLKKLE